MPKQTTQLVVRKHVRGLPGATKSNIRNDVETKNICALQKARSREVTAIPKGDKQTGKTGLLNTPDMTASETLKVIDDQADEDFLAEIKAETADLKFFDELIKTEEGGCLVKGFKMSAVEVELGDLPWELEVEN